MSHLAKCLSSKNQETSSADEGVEEGEPFCTVGGNADWCSHCGKQYGDTSEKLNMKLPYDPGIPLLEIYLKKTKTLIRKNVSTPMFIAALFTITKIWKQPKCIPTFNCMLNEVKFMWNLQIIFSSPEPWLRVIWLSSRPF